MFGLNCWISIFLSHWRNSMCIRLCGYGAFGRVYTQYAQSLSQAHTSKYTRTHNYYTAYCLALIVRVNIRFRRHFNLACMCLCDRQTRARAGDSNEWIGTYERNTLRHRCVYTVHVCEVNESSEGNSRHKCGRASVCVRWQLNIWQKERKRCKAREKQ